MTIPRPVVDVRALICYLNIKKKDFGCGLAGGALFIELIFDYHKMHCNMASSCVFDFSFFNVNILSFTVNNFVIY